MDLFQRAANLFDKAQDRMATATTQAARIVMTAAQMRALEARQEELRRQIEQATVDLGRLTFQRWKNRGVGNDSPLAALCSQIDALNTEYQRILTDLAEARAAMAGSPPHAPSPPGGVIMAGNPYAAPYAPQAPFASIPLPGAPAPDPFLTAALPPAPARPTRPARECPECYALVPGTADFCPSCGMRV